MGDRYLREALLRSDLYNALSVEARELFTRLILIVDDFGCFDGRDTVIAGAVYPLDVHNVSEPLGELHRAGLIVRYSNRGKGYIGIVQWAELLRKNRRRFPAPPINIDKPKVKYRGAFNRPMDWSNPEGSDDVSVLLDTLGRAVTPQPPEWRRPGDLMPLACDTPQQNVASLVSQPSQGSQALAPKRERESQPSAPKHGEPSPVSQALDANHRVPVSTSTAVSTSTPTAAAVAAAAAASVPSLGTQGSAATTTANGEIQLMDSGEWHGVSEAQRLKWQGMFDGMSIGDQLERAAEWLIAHPEKRSEYSGVEGGLRSFIVNWLLREARGAPKPH